MTTSPVADTELYLEQERDGQYTIVHCPYHQPGEVPVYEGPSVIKNRLGTYSDPGMATLMAYAFTDMAVVVMLQKATDVQLVNAANKLREAGKLLPIVKL